MPNAPAYAAIWDVDGTLVDTAELHFQAWVALAAEIAKPFTRADFGATFGQRNPEIIRKLFGMNYTDREVDELGTRKEDLYKAAARHGVDLLPGVRSLLDGLRAEGFRQAIGSSAPRGNLELILDLTDSRAFFDVVVSMEDVHRGKPDPEVFLAAASRLGVPPARCAVFEDAPAGVQAARAGGMKCVAVSFVGHHSDAVLREAGADVVVRTLEQVDADAVRQLVAP